MQVWLPSGAHPFSLEPRHASQLLNTVGPHGVPAVLRVQASISTRLLFMHVPLWHLLSEHTRDCTALESHTSV